MSASREPAIIEQKDEIHALGAGMDSSDSRIMKDAPLLGKRLTEARRAHPFEAKRPRLFVAVTSGYDEASGRYHYAMGDVVESLDGAPEGLEAITVPAGTYAAFIVRPLLGFLWGPAIARTYARAYGAWLPSSAWRSAPGPFNHYEYHDERAARKRGAEMEIRIRVERR
jgi:predicted transcriptional regulator YdeE